MSVAEAVAADGGATAGQAVPWSQMKLSEVAAPVDDVTAAWERSFLGGLPADLSAELFEASTVEDVEAGGMVLRGEAASCFVIVGGLVRIYLCGRDGRQVTIRYAEQTEFVGMPPVIAGRMPVWGEALTSVRLIRLPTERFKTIAQREVSLAWAIARHLAQQISQSNDTLGADLFLPVRARVARHLLDLAHRDTEGLVVEARHRHIANAIGSVREVVSREMRRFAEDGLVKQVEGGTLLLDTAELHRIA